MGTSPMLKDRVAIVTGAGRGIGRAIAKALAAEGAVVGLATRTDSELMSLAEEITAAGGRALPWVTDITDETAVRMLVDGVVGEFGRLDILVNNAAVGKFGPLESFATEDWDTVMHTNVRGPFMLCREAIPQLRKQDRSWIINIGSVVSVKGYVNQAAYSASKHALLGMTKALARELQPDGIRVHAVLPGGVDTTMGGDARPDLDRSVLMQPREVARAVVYLLSQSGNAVTDELHLRREASTPWG